jgi:hypothetical protein
MCSWKLLLHKSTNVDSGTLISTHDLYRITIKITCTCTSKFTDLSMYINNLYNWSLLRLIQNDTNNSQKFGDVNQYNSSLTYSYVAYNVVSCTWTIHRLIYNFTCHIMVTGGYMNSDTLCYWTLWSAAWDYVSQCYCIL